MQFAVFYCTAYVVFKSLWKYTKLLDAKDFNSFQLCLLYNIRDIFVYLYILYQNGNMCNFNFHPTTGFVLLYVSLSKLEIRAYNNVDWHLISCYSRKTCLPRKETSMSCQVTLELIQPLPITFNSIWSQQIHLHILEYILIKSKVTRNHNYIIRL